MKQLCVLDVVACLSVLAFLLFLPSAGALAQSSGIQLVSPMTQLSLEDEMVVRVEVTEKHQGVPALHTNNDFDVDYRGQSSQFQFINGQRSSKTTYSFAVRPLRSGNLTLGPAEVNMGGRQVRSNTLAMRVGAPSQTDAGSAPIFLKASLSKSTAYEHEQIVYTLQFFHRIHIQGASLTFPDFSGFEVHDLGEQQDFTRVVNGQTYRVTQVAKALFPQRAGAVTLTAANARVNIPSQSEGDAFDQTFNVPLDRFFGRTQTRTSNVRSDPLKINVLPLPTPPDNFSGAVGELRAALGVGKTSLQVGESTEVGITLQGDAAPSLLHYDTPTSSDALRFYGGEEVKNTSHQGGILQSSVTRRFALVPAQAGEQQWQAPAFVYFSPKEKSYKTANLSPLVLSVLAPAQPTSAITGAPNNIQSTPVEQTRSQSPSGSSSWLTWLLGIGFAITSGSTFMLAWKNRFPRAGAQQQKRHVSLRQARHELRRSLEQSLQLSAGLTPEHAQTMYAHALSYFALILNQPQELLTGEGIATHFTEHSDGSTISPLLRSFWLALNQCRYAPDETPMNKDMWHSTAEQVFVLLKNKSLEQAKL